MEEIQRIDSAQNPRVKAAVKLRKKQVREETGRTIVEGFREIQRAIDSGWKFHELYCAPALFPTPFAHDLVTQIRAAGILVFECSETAFRKMSYRETPDGLLAISPLVGKRLDELALSNNPLLLIAEDLEKPGNLGTMLRTADAAGVDAVIACDINTDLNNPNVIRSSIGSLFFVPVAEATTREAVEWLAKNNIQTVAATPEASCVYTSIDFRSPTAIVVGSEDNGLSNVWKQQANRQVGIPMLGKNDSLNVATAAAILLYEAVRQRHS